MIDFMATFLLCLKSSTLKVLCNLKSGDMSQLILKEQCHDIDFSFLITSKIEENVKEHF